MLMRRASAPTLRSWVKDPFPEALIRRSASLSLSSNSYSLVTVTDPIKKNQRAFSESDFRDLSKAKNKHFPNGFPQVVICNSKKQHQQEEKVVTLGLDELRTVSLDCWLLSPAGLDESIVVGADDDEECDFLMGGGDGCGNGDCRISGGVGGGGDDGCSGSRNDDEYYQKMIKANPGNALLLGNYAKFLKEVRGDLVKSEEYCGRAILSNGNDGNDGNVFTLYGDLMWEAHKDIELANCYFDQAVQASPNDCYVLASYARFLWVADEAEDDEKEQHKISITFTRAPGTNFLPRRLAAPYNDLFVFSVSLFFLILFTLLYRGNYELSRSEVHNFRAQKEFY